jgi:hypothetical protein
MKNDSVYVVVRTQAHENGEWRMENGEWRMEKSNELLLLQTLVTSYKQIL